MTKQGYILRTVFIALNGLLFASQLIPLNASESTITGGLPKQPNILIIYSDDHAYQAISAYGDSRHLIDTPNLDRLAREGMRFDRCLVTNSLCGPARAAVLTGKYAHLNGFYNNTNCRFDGSQTTYPKVLQQAGYQTAYYGKWHLESEPTGFDDYAVLHGQGQYFDAPFIANGKETKSTGYVTDVVREKGLAWLDHRDPSKPFLLVIANKATHGPWVANPKDLDFDHDRVYQPPSTFFDDYSGRGIAEHEQKQEIAQIMPDSDFKLKPSKHAGGEVPERFKPEWDAYYQPRNAKFESEHLTGKELALWKYNRFMHDYLACVKSVDDNVGTILKYLDDHDLAKNTIAVYSSDQGAYLGEHGWFDKRWIFEESLKTPCIVRWPEVIKPGSVNKSIVSNLDFAETFIDAAGVPVPAEMQGRSLIPLFQGKTPGDWRTAFYYHYYEYPFGHHVRPHYGIVTDQYKLVHFYRDSNYWELFDLAKDPNELLSVYGNPEYAGVTAKLMKQLHDLEIQLKVPPNDSPQALGGKNKISDAGDID
jgi:arylsulfatase A-like enzyme